MSTRTFKQLGQAHGSLPTTIVAKIDGQVVFSGPVSTVAEPLPMLPDLNFRVENEIFSWTRDTMFAGPMSLEITVEGSPLLLTDTQADYATDQPADQGVFTGFYMYEKDGAVYGDPFSDEAIDGIPDSRQDDPELTGQWYWTIMPGSTFTATINVQASKIPTPPPPVV